MGFLDKLFGTGKENPANRKDFEADGAICYRCGKPIPRAQLALDSGAGKPIHQVCPTSE